MAIAQFSDDARTEFQLSSHSNKEALLEAIQKISYKGGNTKTGVDSILMYSITYVAGHCSSTDGSSRALHLCSFGITCVALMLEPAGQEVAPNPNP